MFDQLMTENYFPFTVSLALLMGLLVLELVLAFLGGSLFGDGVDAPEMDAPDMDVGVDLDGLDLDAAEVDLGDFDAPDAPDAPDTGSPAAAIGAIGILAWLGFGKMPAAIWLASVFLAFGLAGMTVQLVATSLIATPLPVLMAVLPAVAVAIWFARTFGMLFARLLPKTETQALSERQLARRKGVVSQGTAARGRPAEVRIIDQYGNMHYIRAEPLRDDEIIPQGTEVLVVRLRLDDTYRLVSLG